MTIPQSFIQELLARADVVEIVGRHVQLKKGGANFMGLCPFHGEKSPSFSVSPSKQFYHCFGCGVSGNAIGFLMAHAGMGFVEAVHDLAGEYGLQVPEDHASPAERERAVAQRQRQSTLTEVLEKAVEAYAGKLKDAPHAIDYLKGRGLSGAIAKRFDIGYAPGGGTALASVFPRYDDPLLVESGLVILADDDSQRRYDRFRDRVMFPIRNVKGECIGFGGRVLGDEKPKYLNSPETPVFSKGRELYGLFEARAALREHGYALVTEGYMDVVALAQLGFPNAVATLGTACTADHVQKLFRFTDAVVFSFDGDAAGRRAARKALEGALPYASDVRSCKFLFLPAEHDPDSFIREHGAEAFQRFVNEATPLSRFMVEVAREGCDLASAEGRAHLASNARPLWSALPEGALKRQMLGEIAELVQLDARELSQVWNPAGKAEAARRPWRSHGAASDFSRPSRRLATLPSLEANARNIVVLLLRDGSFWEALSAADHEVLCSIEGLHGDFLRWLDQQSYEHGAQPLAALMVGLQGLPFEPMIKKLLEFDQLQPYGRMMDHSESSFPELRLAIVHLRLDLSIAEMKQIEGQPSTDPTGSERLRHLVMEQMKLRAEREALKKSSLAII